MRKMLRRKLKSCDGVSLAVAMLMFMACAVVGTVVLTAATAVGGRLKDMTELDQRYYSAASAVALLKEELCGHPVTIVRKKMVTVETETTDSSDSMSSSEVIFQTTIGTEEPMVGEDPVKLGQLDTIPDGRSFLTWMAVCLLFDNSNEGDGNIYCNTNDAMDYTFTDGVSSMVDPDSNYDNVTTGDFWLVHSPNDILPSSETTNLSAQCHYELKKDGTLVLQVTENMPLPVDQRLTQHYTLNLTLMPSFTETPLLELTSYDVSDDGTKVTTYTRISTVSWTVESVG